MNKELLIIKNRFIDATLQSTSSEIDFTTSSRITEDTIYSSSLISIPENREMVGRVRDILLETASGQSDDFQSLFEAAYSYGMQGYDGESFIKLKPTFQKIYRRNLLEQEEISLDGKRILPENPSQVISQRFVGNRFMLAKQIYLSGLAAGVLASEPLDQEDIKIDEPVITSLSSEVFINLPELKRILQRGIQADPVTVTRAIVPSLDRILSLQDLTDAEDIANFFLPGYLKKRVETIIQAKKKSKKSYMQDYIIQNKPTKLPKQFSSWSIDYEDTNQEKAKTILLGQTETNNKQIYNTSSRLARMELISELLIQNLSRSEIPEELDLLMNIFLLEESENLDDYKQVSKDIYERFTTFITTQSTSRIVSGEIEAFMSSTAYWKSSEKRQTITPDTFEITEEQYSQIKEINDSYGLYLETVRELYCEAAESYTSSNTSASLVNKLEGGLSPELIPIVRSLMKNQGKIGSMRFDLIPDQRGKLWVGEVQIISGGTPPAMLYREAFEKARPDSKPIGPGVLPALIKRVLKKTDDPFLITLYSDRPYSSDIAKTTSLAGNRSLVERLNESKIRTESAFPKDIFRGDSGLLYLKNDTTQLTPITTLYNRVDYVSKSAIKTLTDPGMQDILKAISENDVDCFPEPLPILMGKGIYALIWDDTQRDEIIRRLGEVTYEKLREYTPPTYWITPENLTILTAAKEWIRKGSYDHATMNLIMGIDSPTEFLETTQNDIKNPYSAVAQRYIDSLMPNFRIKRSLELASGIPFTLWIKTPYRLRIEPTSIDQEICEVFVTGSSERIVHGRSNSIMTIAVIKGGKND